MKTLDNFVDRTVFGIYGKLEDLVRMFPSYGIFLKDGENILPWEQLKLLFNQSVYVPGITFFERWIKSEETEILEYPSFLWNSSCLSNIIRVCPIDYYNGYHVLFDTGGYEEGRGLCDLKVSLLSRVKYSDIGRVSWKDFVTPEKIDFSILLRRYWNNFTDGEREWLYNHSLDADTYGTSEALKMWFKEE